MASATDYNSLVETINDLVNTAPKEVMPRTSVGRAPGQTEHVRQAGLEKGDNRYSAGQHYSGWRTVGYRDLYPDAAQASQGGGVWFDRMPGQTVLVRNSNSGERPPMTNLGLAVVGRLTSQFEKDGRQTIAQAPTAWDWSSLGWVTDILADVHADWEDEAVLVNLIGMMHSDARECNPLSEDRLSAVLAPELGMRDRYNTTIDYDAADNANNTMTGRVCCLPLDTFISLATGKVRAAAAQQADVLTSASLGRSVAVVPIKASDAGSWYWPYLYAHLDSRYWNMGQETGHLKVNGPDGSGFICQPIASSTRIAAPRKAVLVLIDTTSKNIGDAWRPGTGPTMTPWKGTGNITWVDTRRYFASWLGLGQAGAGSVSMDSGTALDKIITRSGMGGNMEYVYAMCAELYWKDFFSRGAKWTPAAQNPTVANWIEGISSQLGSSISIISEDEPGAKGGLAAKKGLGADEWIYPDNDWTKPMFYTTTSTAPWDGTWVCLKENSGGNAVPWSSTLIEDGTVYELSEHLVIGNTGTVVRFAVRWKEHADAKALLFFSGIGPAEGYANGSLTQDAALKYNGVSDYSKKRMAIRKVALYDKHPMSEVMKNPPVEQKPGTSEWWTATASGSTALNAYTIVNGLSWEKWDNQSGRDVGWKLATWILRYGGLLRLSPFKRGWNALWDVAPEIVRPDDQTIPGLMAGRVICHTDESPGAFLWQVKTAEWQNRLAAHMELIGTGAPKRRFTGGRDVVQHCKGLATLLGSLNESALNAANLSIGMVAGLDKPLEELTIVMDNDVRSKLPRVGMTEAAWNAWQYVGLQEGDARVVWSMASWRGWSSNSIAWWKKMGLLRKFGKQVTWTKLDQITIRTGPNGTAYSVARATYTPEDWMKDEWVGSNMDRSAQAPLVITWLMGQRGTLRTGTTLDYMWDKICWNQNVDTYSGWRPLGNAVGWGFSRVEQMVLYTIEAAPNWWTRTHCAGGEEGVGRVEVTGWSWPDPGILATIAAIAAPVVTAALQRLAGWGAGKLLGGAAAKAATKVAAPLIEKGVSKLVEKVAPTVDEAKEKVEPAMD